MKTKKGKRRAVKAEEEKLASALGGRRTFNSGAGDEKGDARVHQTYQVVDGSPQETSEFAFRIESKTTEKVSGYRLNVKDWKKLRDAALGAGETPVFVVRMPRFLRGHLRLAVVPVSFANALLSVDKQTVSHMGKKRSFKLSEKVWNLCTSELPRTAEQDVPHIRISIGDGSKDYDLVVLEWEWFTHLTNCEEEG